MSESIFSKLVREPNGAFTVSYGPYLLQSALQPLFREKPDGRVEIAALKGLIRASLDGVPCSPADFFASIPPEESLAVDGLCRSLHILNAGNLGRRETSVIVNFHPGLYMTHQMMRHEVERLRLAAHEAGLPASAIACDIREHPDDEPDFLGAFADHFHANGLSVAIDNYSGEDRDLARLERLNPQFVTFDTMWLHEFARSSAGLALLRVFVGQFAERGITAIVAGIEDPDMIEICRGMGGDKGGPLMQGYLLSRPALAPTTFNIDFPEPDPSYEESALTGTGDPAPTRPVRQFGKRGL